MADMTLAKSTSADITVAKTDSAIAEQAQTIPETVSDHFRFLDLSPELRLLVYEAYMDDAVWIVDDEANILTCTPLRGVCKLIFTEYNPLYLRAHWQTRRIEVAIWNLNFGRLNRFVNDQGNRFAHYQHNPKPNYAEDGPLDVKIKLVFEHDSSDRTFSMCNAGHAKTFEHWLIYHETQWSVRYEVDFVLDQHSPFLDYFGCLLTEFSDIMDWIVVISGVLGEECSRSVVPVRDDFNREASACIVEHVGLTEVSDEVLGTPLALLKQVLPSSEQDGWKCKACPEEGTCGCDHCRFE